MDSGTSGNLVAEVAPQRLTHDMVLPTNQNGVNLDESLVVPSTSKYHSDAIYTFFISGEQVGQTLITNLIVKFPDTNQIPECTEAKEIG